MKLILRIIINSAALWAAAAFVPGIRYNTLWSLVATALIFGVVNALIRPVLKLLSCPVIVLTLGLFTLVLNALMLMLTARIGHFFGIGFTVHGFWAAFFGALIVSIVSTVLAWLLPEKDR